ncbi:MAG: M67 family metallopeptidase [Flavobacteriales bacterium]|nr:M67 family metallopeptidase [Flavobacteriales bacterium]
MKKVSIGHEALEVMKRDALRSFPDECCGFMYGRDGDPREITLAVEVENKKEGDKRRRFEISPLQYMKAEQFGLESGLTLLGVYHSHPLHPAIASEHDRVVAMPYFSYVILSTFENEVADVKSWQLNDNRQFEEEPVLLPQTQTTTK